MPDSRISLRSFAAETSFLSHFHWDHTGDPSTFPHSTDLVVGPGFKDAFIPGYPANQDAPIRESDYANRKLREISFDEDLTIGGYKALDYFNDGSFYLLDSPGVSLQSMPTIKGVLLTPLTDTACHRPYVRSCPVGGNALSLSTRGAFFTSLSILFNRSCKYCVQHFD